MRLRLLPDAEPIEMFVSHLDPEREPGKLVEYEVPILVGGERRGTTTFLAPEDFPRVRAIHMVEKGA